MPNENDFSLIQHLDFRDLRARIDAARSRLAELEAAYTIDKAKVDRLGREIEELSGHAAPV